MPSTTDLQVATLGGGCFWCLDAVFRRLRGVSSVTSGFAGGHVRNPGYREVCTGTTGHAEVVQVAFDPSEITYRELLEVFMGTHDPTTLDRQGADVGSQYRSIILTHSPEQQRTAESLLAELTSDNVFGAPIVTEIEPVGEFFPAELHHQDYYERNARQPYCQAVIAPKVAKLRAKFAGRLRPEALAAAD
jgi:peptide-methionine (S)-S-oxide reductase